MGYTSAVDMLSQSDFDTARENLRRLAASEGQS